MDKSKNKPGTDRELIKKEVIKLLLEVQKDLMELKELSRSMSLMDKSLNDMVDDLSKLID